MKNLITTILLFVAANVTAQDLTLLHINAKWNSSNDYNLDRIRNAKVTMAKLEDQKPELKAQIKAVPTIILIGKDGSILWRHNGYLPGDEKYIEAEIRSALGLLD